MSNKYYKMHEEVLNICEVNDIKMIPGKRVAYEIFSGRDLKGIKEFLLTPDDMAAFSGKCVDDLKKRGYVVTKGKTGEYELYRIFGPEILATSVPALMNNPDGRHCPQFIIRGMKKIDRKYSYMSNKVIISFDESELETIERLTYMGGSVYAKKDLAEHSKKICNTDINIDIPLQGYPLFSGEYSAAEFLKEAEDRGYLSKKHIDRYKEYTSWRKENRAENDKKFREYQETLLGLKQP